MGKKRRKPGVDDDNRGARSEPSDPAEDPLGKLIEQFHVSLSGILLLSGIMLLVGVGLLVFAFTRQPSSLLFVLIGTAVLLLTITFLGMNVFNVGRRFELRKRGVRFVESGIITEFLWNEIVNIEVNRTDDTNLGIVGVQRRSADAVSPSGLLTATEWDVTIHAQGGRTIRLPPMFFRAVADPKKLIGHLRLRAGVG